jgi:hypothetical protein
MQRIRTGTLERNLIGSREERRERERYGYHPSRTFHFVQNPRASAGATATSHLHIKYDLRRMFCSESIRRRRQNRRRRGRREGEGGSGGGGIIDIKKVHTKVIGSSWSSRRHGRGAAKEMRTSEAGVAVAASSAMSVHAPSVGVRY